jgi:hypothetical protein
MQSHDGRTDARLGDDTPERLSNRELLSRIVGEGTDLMKKEIALARAEIADDLRSELTVAKAMGAGAVLALCGLNLALVTLVFLLALALPGWAAALIVTGAVLAAAAIVAAVGWSKRVRSPLARTRRHVKSDARWMKEQLA